MVVILFGLLSARCRSIRVILVPLQKIGVIVIHGRGKSRAAAADAIDGHYLGRGPGSPFGKFASGGNNCAFMILAPLLSPALLVLLEPPT